MHGGLGQVLGSVSILYGVLTTQGGALVVVQGLLTTATTALSAAINTLLGPVGLAVVAKACKVIVIWAQCNGYKGSSISVSGNGISNVVSADNCTKHSFGEWGSLHCAGFGCNIPKGTTVTVNGSGNLDATRSINVRYFE